MAWPLPGRDSNILPAARTVSHVSSLRFRPAKVPHRSCHARIHRRSTESGCRLPLKERASFVRGRCVRGTYVPSDQAKEITKSRSFTKPSRVLARFSMDDTSQPIENGLLRGFSFRLGIHGQRSEIVAQSAPVHFARTLDQMMKFLAARVPGPDGNPDREKVEVFSATHPERCVRQNTSLRIPAHELCQHDLLGSARFSGDKFKRRDTVHQVQDCSG